MFNDAVWFAPIEEALATVFILAILQEREVEPVAHLRDLLALSVCQAGLGIPNPTKTAADGFRASIACTKTLTESLLDHSELDTVSYSSSVTAARTKMRKARTMLGLAELQMLCNAEEPMASQRMIRAKDTGGWLNTLPSSLNGTVLSEEEFHDSLRLRFGLIPNKLPSTWEGFGQSFNVDHAMMCKKGGLILHLHNDVVAEWGEICARALKPSAVSNEPHIHHGRDTPQATGNTGAKIDPDLQGDIGVHGFWKCGVSAIFDIRITDTDAKSYRGMDPHKVLKSQEREKKKTYSDACRNRYRHFTPLVFSVDGLSGVEATATIKRVAALLSTKWKRAYSEICGFVRSRISIALVGAASHCLRGARDPTARLSTATWESGAGLSPYC